MKHGKTLVLLQENLLIFSLVENGYDALWSWKRHP